MLRRKLGAIGLALLLGMHAASAGASVMDGKGSPGSFRGERQRDAAFRKLKQKAAGMTCSSYAAICRKNNANAPACNTSYSGCMATGVFVGPKGAIIPDVVQR